MGLFFFKRNRPEKDLQGEILRGLQAEVIEEIKDLKKALRRQGLQLEVLKKEIQEIPSEKEKKRITASLEISEGFFHLEKLFKGRATLSISQIKSFGMVWERIENLLHSQDISLIRAEGVRYDPRFYEAVETTGNGNALPTVKEVIIPGYQIKGKVVKAAKAIIQQ